MGFDFAAAFSRARATNTHADGDRPGRVTGTEAKAIVAEAQAQGASASEIVDGFERTPGGRRLLQAATWELRRPAASAIAAGSAHYGKAWTKFTVFAGLLVLTVKDADRTARGVLFDSALGSIYGVSSDADVARDQLRGLLADPALQAARDAFVSGEYPEGSPITHGVRDGVEKVSFPLPEIVLAPR
jgi:hypothetical protein